MKSRYLAAIGLILVFGMGAAVTVPVPFEVVHRCPTVADLDNRATFPRIKDGDAVELLGYQEEGDGGGQTLYYDAQSAEADDNGFVFNSIDLPGRFIAIDRSTANALQFGAIPDDDLDDTAAFQQAIDSLTENNNGGVLRVPAGEYDIANVYIRKGVRVEGMGGGRVREYGASNEVNEGLGTICNVTGAAYGFILGEPLVGPFNEGTQPRANGAELANCLIQCTSSSLGGVVLGSVDNYKGGGNEQLVENVVVRDADSAVVEQAEYDKSSTALGSADGSFSGTASVTGGVGVYVMQGINCTLRNVTTEHCHWGLSENAASRSSTVNVQHCSFRQCEQGVWLQSAVTYRFVANIIESNEREGLLVKGQQAGDRVLGLDLISNHFESNSRGADDWTNVDLSERVYAIRIDGTAGGDPNGIRLVGGKADSGDAPNIFIADARDIALDAKIQTTVSQYDLVTENVEAVEVRGELQALRNVDTAGTTVFDRGSSGTTTENMAGTTVNATGMMGWTGLTTLRAPADGGLQIRNNAETVSVRLNAKSSAVLSLNNDSSAHQIHIHNNATQYGLIGWQSNILTIGTEGAANAIGFAVNGTRRWEFDTSFRLVPVADNARDIGTQSLRVRSLYTSGGYEAGIVTSTTTHSATVDNHTILCDATAGAFDVDLPAAASHTGRVYVIKKIDASGNAVSIDPNSTELIDGTSTSLAISAQWGVKTIQSNGTSWFVIGN